MNKTIKTLTLGCKVNQYETEYMRCAFKQLGYVDVCDASDEPADLVIINTCTVTAQSDFKSRKAIRRLVKENPNAEIIVMGCFAANNIDELKTFTGVTEVLTDKRELADFMMKCGLSVPPTGISSFGERHRAYVKIQDGCRVGCAYCIIPKVRPYLLSRNCDEVLHEIRTLSAAGYAEIVLTGIHLGHYGVDLLPKTNLADIVRQIVELIRKESLELRIRISSLEAVEVSDELVELVRKNQDVICPHFHISMQSGSDEVLERMKRRWMSGPFLKKCEQFLDRFDKPALTTDVIVGFPGETEEQFEETCKLVEKIGFSKVHVFRFSPRKGTVAATLPDPVPPEVKKRRAAHLQLCADKLRFEYAKSLVGTQMQVLLETEEPNGMLSGTADRYLKVTVTNTDKNLLGKLVNVSIQEANGEELLGNF
ncbi:MAG: tRNA (N(6)-L-threonylcarbamoyladenosine(37)-C(2))-methylthiotransferase MtaB [Thermoguttaceae bacterium]